MERVFGEKMIPIKDLDEWSIMQNKAIKVFNKPKHVVTNKTAFAMTLSQRY